MFLLPLELHVPRFVFHVYCFVRTTVTILMLLNLVTCYLIHFPQFTIPGGVSSIILTVRGLGDDISVEIYPVHCSIIREAAVHYIDDSTDGFPSIVPPVEEVPCFLAV